MPIIGDRILLEHCEMEIKRKIEALLFSPMITNGMTLRVQKPKEYNLYKNYRGFQSMSRILKTRYHLIPVIIAILVDCGKLKSMLYRVARIRFECKSRCSRASALF